MLSEKTVQGNLHTVASEVLCIAELQRYRFLHFSCITLQHVCYTVV